MPSDDTRPPGRGVMAARLERLLPMEPIAVTEGRAAVDATLAILEDPALGLAGEWDGVLGELAAGLAAALGDGPGAEDLRRYARYHDIGKVYCLDVLLRPGPLGPAGTRAMQAHPLLGAELLRQAGFPPAAVAMAALHHERVDGSGYPMGVRDLPVAVRALQVADIYCALRSERVYKPAWDDRRAQRAVAAEAAEGRLCREVAAALPGVVRRITLGNPLRPPPRPGRAPGPSCPARRR